MSLEEKKELEATVLFQKAVCFSLHQMVGVLPNFSNFPHFFLNDNEELNQKPGPGSGAIFYCSDCRQEKKRF